MAQRQVLDSGSKPNLMMGMCAQLPKGCRWEMEMRAQSELTWHSIHSSSSTSAVTAKGLMPGTKYVFRARAGVFTSFPQSPPDAVVSKWQPSTAALCLYEASCTCSTFFSP